jgi:ribosome biogenesis GTPase A
MAIQWFPGHMNSARNKAAETMEITDLVIEVVDARCPMASSNPMVEEMRLFRQRPCLKILNKADLADSKVTQQWLDALNAQYPRHCDEHQKSGRGRTNPADLSPACAAPQ